MRSSKRLMISRDRMSDIAHERRQLQTGRTIRGGNYHSQSRVGQFLSLGQEMKIPGGGSN